jgi:hypothetical protein
MLCAPINGVNVVERIRLRVSSTGAVTVMCKCSVCHGVSEHAIGEAAEQLIPCVACGHAMDIRKATIEAVDRGLGDPQDKGEGTT